LNQILRSFDPRRMHGTLLPAATPLDILMAEGSDISDSSKEMHSATSTHPRRQVRKAPTVPGVAIRLSSGNHASIRTKDVRAAERNRTMQEQRDARTTYWL
jgi:hypothetical protein